MIDAIRLTVRKPFWIYRRTRMWRGQLPWELACRGGELACFSTEDDALVALRAAARGYAEWWQCHRVARQGKFAVICDDEHLLWRDMVDRYIDDRIRLDLDDHFHVTTAVVTYEELHG